MLSWNLKTRGLRPIGLDIGHNAIKMIQLLINESQIGVLAADKICIDPSINGDGQRRQQFVVSSIKRVLEAGKFQGRGVVSCLPNEKVRTTSLRLPEAEAAQIEQALAKEAADRFGLDPNKDAIDYMIAGSVRQGDEIKNELILFAIDDETIKDHIAMLEEAQLKPVAIDTIPCALFRSFERSLRRHEDRERTVVFVDIGGCFTTVVFGRGGDICFVKQMAIGGVNFDREIAAKLGVDIPEAGMLRSRLRAERGLPLPETEWVEHAPKRETQALDAMTRQVIVDAIGAVAEELAREISLCFRYYTVTFRGKRVERAFLTGGEAYENILLNVLARKLAVEIEVAQPLKGFNLSGEDMHIYLDGDRRGLLCEWAVAVGLSLKGWNGAAG
jgi:type IV pilus assembly protein PilM